MGSTTSHLCGKLAFRSWKKRLGYAWGGLEAPVPRVMLPPSVATCSARPAWQCSAPSAQGPLIGSLCYAQAARTAAGLAVCHTVLHAQQPYSAPLVYCYTAVFCPTLALMGCPASSLAATRRMLCPLP